MIRTRAPVVTVPIAVVVVGLAALLSVSAHTLTLAAPSPTVAPSVPGPSSAPASPPTVASVSVSPSLRRASPQADPGDVATPDAIVEALYEVISGPPGPRDWDRLRSLFHPQARMIPTGPDPRAPGARRTAVWTVDEYIEQVTPFFDERGFYEREIGRVTERFGGVVHLFSAYESRVDPESEEPFQRGINSIQLVQQDDRWWILTVLWEGESDDNPIPQRYLRSE